MDTKIDFLYLSEPDMIKAGVKDMGKCVDCMEDLLVTLNKGDYMMGGENHNSHGCMIMFPDDPKFPGMPKNGPDRRFMAMPAYLGGKHQLAGMKLRDADEDIYRQVGVIMYVQRQYDSYNTYMEMNRKTEALNALIKGMERYDTYIDEAKFLGVGDDVEAIKKQIVTALQKSFSISESEAETLVDLSKKDFTQYYLKIEAYGEA